MNLTSENIRSYVEKYLNNIFNQKIHINIRNENYIINKKLEYKIYRIWEKSDKELLNDFKQFSFKSDYVGTIFFFLSGYWEYIHKDKKDQYGRFLYIESFQYKKNIIEKPIVDIIVDKIKNELGLSYKINIPSIFITHDIDHLFLLKGSNFCKSILWDVVKIKKVKPLLKKVCRKLENKDPYDIENLIKIHKKYHSKGTFFFMTKVQPKNFDGGYNLKKNIIYLKNIKSKIEEINGDIGIHYDVRYFKEDHMKIDIKNLEDIFNLKIKSGRAHYLIFDITKTFDILEKSNIILDSTGGYAEHIGFRFGTCKPFKPYNFKEKREYNLIEVPLSVMDGTLKNKKYMNLTPKEGFEKIKKLVDIIKKYNGILTFLWHNSSFFSYNWNNWEWVYEETIKYALTKELKSTNTEDIVKRRRPLWK